MRANVTRMASRQLFAGRRKWRSGSQQRGRRGEYGMEQDQGDRLRRHNYLSD